MQSTKTGEHRNQIVQLLYYKIGKSEKACDVVHKILCFLGMEVFFLSAKFYDCVLFIVNKLFFGFVGGM